jgi:hypothetical protein
VGQHSEVGTAGTCDASNNLIINDPTGAGYGKIWEGWWNPGDPPLAGHETRCEADMNQPNYGVGNWLYRDLFMVPADSWIPDQTFNGYSQRIQFHGNNTSPPVDMMIRRNPVDPSKFQVRFMAGFKYKFWTNWTGSYSPGQWIGLEIRVRWTQASDGWVEFYINGQPIVGVDGTIRQEGVTLIFIEGQGQSTTVYKKYGIDGRPAALGYVHHYHALSEGYRLP